MQEFKVTVLKDSTETDKGNKTAFLRVSIDTGFIDNEVAVGFSRVNKELKAGETMTIKAEEVQLRVSETTFKDKDGKDVHGQWLVFK